MPGCNPVPFLTTTRTVPRYHQRENTIMRVRDHESESAIRLQGDWQAEGKMKDT
ncbi:MAG: hypothetical protein ACTSUE_24655 [Promethearchaeota archaeon]